MASCSYLSGTFNVASLSTAAAPRQRGRWIISSQHILVQCTIHTTVEVLSGLAAPCNEIKMSGALCFVITQVISKVQEENFRRDGKPSGSFVFVNPYICPNSASGNVAHV